MSSASSSRPITSKARGVCIYYNTPRGCFAGDKCKFLHAEPLTSPKSDDPPLLTPYDKSKRCRYYAEGFCKRGDTCWFLHTSDLKDKGPAAIIALEEDEEESCSICFEKPSTYGLLGGCSHIFCITCIKQWRDPQNKPGGVLDSGNTKKCPMCRLPSKFITPSSRFWKDGTPEKAKVIQSYKDSMARVPCRYFQKSLQKNKNKPICPYGMDCFYQHVMEDGTPFIFKDGVDVSMRRYRSAQGHRVFIDNLHFMPFLNMASLDLAGLLDGQDNNRHRGGANPVAHATRRLQEVERSLEILNDVIIEGATTGNLNRAVQALRAGFGRADGGAQPTANRRQGAEEEPAERQEAEVIDQLGILADQMLASLDALREVQDGRPETPPPPLEPIRNTDNAPHRHRPVARDSDDESEGSMPALQSVSNTSESEYDEYDDDDDSSDEDSDHGSDDFGSDGGDAEGDMVTAAAMAEIFRSMMAPPEASPNPPPPRTPTPPEIRSNARFRTTVGQSTEAATEDGENNSDTDSDSLPALEMVCPSARSSPEPPFVTDGRGRVVWSSPGEENKEPGRRMESEEFTTDGRGRVISVGAGESAGTAGAVENTAEGSGSTPGSPGSSGGAGRSLLGWINSLF